MSARDSLFSPSWYRVADLKPRIRRHAQIHRHSYRDEIWYVMQDHSSGRFHRFTPAANLVIGFMDGQRSVQEVWELASEKLGDDMPTQEEVIQLLAQLHQADVLQCDVPPDTEELLGRFEKQRRMRIKRNFKSPLALIFPLIDPEKLLKKTETLGRWIFSWSGLVLWLLVVGGGVIMAGLHWPDLTENLADRVLSANNLFLIWLIFPVVKALHEFGHALATKRWGGEVHEMGVMLLVLMPIPYVDASSASAFRDKRQRMMVGAAGMFVELFLAALALFVWLNVESGLVSTLAYNVILIAGVSTILFNANPLIRFDGYYILGDFLEVPNLAQRSNQYLGYLIQKYLFKIKHVNSPVNAVGEKGWFVFYALASFVYRMFIMVFITMFVATKFFVIGIVLAMWAAANMAILPLYRQVKFLFTSPGLRGRRQTALTITGVAVAVVALLLFWMPMPYWSQAEGVIWVPEKSHVRAGANSFIQQIVARHGQLVNKGQPLVICSDPELNTLLKVLEARLAELESRYRSEIVEDRVRAEVTREEMRQVEAEIAVARERVANLVVRSETAGRFVIGLPQDKPGRFVTKGELLGYVLDLEQVTARVVVSQANVDLVRQQLQGVKVRMAEQLEKILPARITREVPAATDQLPSLALGSVGGGEIAIDPRDPKQAKSLEKLFLFDLAIPAEANVSKLGGRVYVRFDHGWMPLALQWYRGLRQLLLSQFSV
jgi:putative peptide zinc metalloprotease protein